MGKYLGPKNKLSRREGFDLFGKGLKLRRMEIPPGFAKGRRAKKLSEYAKQLREKQKTKRLYGLRENQFKNYFVKARKTHKNIADMLIRYLETRLDNVVFRLGLSQTRVFARQMVSHGHVLVNGKKLNIASYQVKVGDVISLDPKMNQNLKITLPVWLERQATIGKIKRLPNSADIHEPVSIETIVEYYSR